MELPPLVIGPTPGRFDAGVVTVPTATPGAVIEAAVAGWAGNAASFDQAVVAGALAIISESFSVDTGNPNAAQPEPPAAIIGPGQFQGLVFQIPEPSSLGLALLAAAFGMRFAERRTFSCGAQKWAHARSP